MLIAVCRSITIWYEDLTSDTSAEVIVCLWILCTKTLDVDIFLFFFKLSVYCAYRYVMRTPWDNQWGVSQDNGNWTGTVGTLQHHQADFSMLLSWLGSRMAVVDYSRVYVSEPLIIVTSKTGPLPQIFALVRPFPGTGQFVGHWKCPIIRDKHSVIHQELFGLQQFTNVKMYYTCSITSLSMVITNKYSLWDIHLDCF